MIVSHKKLRCNHSSDCHYTCHYKCRSLITLDCRVNQSQSGDPTLEQSIVSWHTATSDELALWQANRENVAVGEDEMTMAVEVIDTGAVLWPGDERAVDELHGDALKQAISDYNAGDTKGAGMTPVGPRK